MFMVGALLRFGSVAAWIFHVFARMGKLGTIEMGYKVVQSYRNILHKNLPNQMNGAHGADSSTKPTEFVNHGLLLWNQSRQKWVGDKNTVTRVQQLRMPKCRSMRLCLAKKFMLCCWNMTNDTFLKSKKPFPRPIQLEEMVDFLVDIWEQEGMYD